MGTQENEGMPGSSSHKAQWEAVCLRTGQVLLKGEGVEKNPAPGSGLSRDE